MVEVEAQALSGDVAAMLLQIWCFQYRAQRRPEQVRCRVVLKMNWVVTFQPAAKLPFARCLGALALLGHFGIKFCSPVLRERNPLLVCLLCTELYWEAKGII